MRLMSKKRQKAVIAQIAGMFEMYRSASDTARRAAQDNPQAKEVLSRVDDTFVTCMVNVCSMVGGKTGFDTFRTIRDEMEALSKQKMSERAATEEASGESQDDADQ